MQASKGDGRASLVAIDASSAVTQSWQEGPHILDDSENTRGLYHCIAHCFYNFPFFSFHYIMCFNPLNFKKQKTRSISHCPLRKIYLLYILVVCSCNFSHFCLLIPQCVQRTGINSILQLSNWVFDWDFGTVFGVSITILVRALFSLLSWRLVTFTDHISILPIWMLHRGLWMRTSRMTLQSRNKKFCRVVMNTHCLT